MSPPTEAGEFQGRLSSGDPFLPLRVIVDRDGVWVVGAVHVVSVDMFEWAEPRGAADS